MSGMKKWMAGSLTAMVVAVGSLASMAGPAQAYDKGNCDRIFGAGNSAVDSFNADTGSSGMVDFGDLWMPWGKAVACWANNGKVAVVGRMFIDSGGPIIFASAKVTLFRDGVAGTEFTAARLTGNTGDSIVSLATSAGFYNRVRIRLFRGDTLVDTITCSRAAILDDCS